MPNPLTAEEILEVVTPTGNAIDSFIAFGQSKNDFEYINFWDQVTQRVVDLTSTDTGLVAAFGDGTTRQSVLETVDAARAEAESTRVQDLQNNKFADRFKVLRNENPSVLDIELADGDTVLTIGTIDVATEENASGPGYVVPASVVIEESFLNQKIETVRTGTSPVIPSYKTSHKITLDIVFPNIDAINKGFRTLYAQSRMLPFITIESPIVTAVFVNQIVTPRIIDAVTQQLVKQSKFSNDVMDIANDARVSLDDAIELLQTNDPFITVIQDKIREELTREQFEDPQVSVPQVQSAVKKITDDISFAIPVAFRGVTAQTIPDKPGALLTRWTFTRIHNGSFHKGEMLFRDATGYPTFDIKKSPYIRKFFKKLLSKNAGTGNFLEPITTDADGSAVKTGLADFLWKDIMENEYALDVTSFIDSQVTLRINSKVVDLPISGSFYSMPQYMGVANIEAHIVYTTTDLGMVQKFNKMKAEFLLEGRKGNFQIGTLEVNHPLLKCVGANRFVINSLSVESTVDYPDLYHITVQLVESKLDVRDTEVLSLATGGVSAEIFRGFMQYLYNVYRIIFKYRDKLDQLHPNDPAKQKSIELVSKILFGPQIGFAVNRGNSGILSPYGNDAQPMVAAIFRRLSNLTTTSYASNAEQDYPSLYNKIDDNGYFTLGTTDITEEELAILTGLDRATPGFGFIRPAGRGDLAISRTIGREGGASWTGRRTAVSIRWAASALIATFNPYFKSGYRSIPKILQAPMPQKTWDAIVDVIAFRAGDKSPKELWSDKHLSHAYLVIYGILTNEAIGFFTDVDDPSGELTTALAPINLIKEQDQLERNGFARSFQRRAGLNSGPRDTSYPDLLLPTYAELFSERDANGVTQLIQAPDDNGNLEPVWTRFAPTYRDLGIPVPLNEDTIHKTLTLGRSQIARSLDDEVEPSVFYHREHVKRDVIEKYFGDHAKASAGSRSIIDKATILPLPYNISEFKDITENQFGDFVRNRLNLTPAISSDPRLDEAREKFQKIKAVDEERIIHLVTTEGRAVGTVIKGPDNKLSISRSLGKRPVYLSSGDIGEFDIQSPEHALQLENSIIDFMEDHSKSMSRCYPTIKLYLIEEDREVQYFYDDFYGYSSIIDCNITTDIEDAAVATLQLSNYTGALSEDAYLTPSVLNNKNNSIADDENEPTLSKFKIKPGTHIQIRMGYNSGSKLLQTVFTGLVAEVQPGEVVTIIAQGFKTELFNEVGFFQQKYSFTADDRPSLRAVINKTLARNGEAPHLGRKFTVSKSEAKSPETSKTLQKLFGQQYSSGFLGTGFGGQFGLWHAFFGAELNDISRNIWYDSPSYINSEWITVTQTAWNAIKEVVRYIPNYISQVVPYDGDATLFVGNPNQIYKYSNGTLYERISYTKLFSKLKNTAAKALSSFIEAGFKRSKFYKVRGFTRTFPRRTGIQLDTDFRTWYKETSNSTILTPYIDNFTSDTSFEYYLKDLQDGFSASTSANRVRLLANQADVSPQWAHIGGINTELQRYLFATFFGFRYTGTPWPGTIEGKWQSYLQYAMKPLTNSGESLTPEGELVLKEAITDKSNSSLSRQANSIGYFTGIIENIKDFEISEANVIAYSGAAAISNNQSRDETLIAEHIRRFIPAFRVFVYNFSEWMKSNESDGKDLRRDVTIRQIHNYRAFGLPPGHKTFRDYHLIDSDEDIIQNNIIASEAEMWNAVSLITTAGIEEWYNKILFNIRGLKEDEINEGINQVRVSKTQEKVSYPSVDGVNYAGRRGGGNDILRVFEEPNAGNTTMAAWALAARMAEGLRRMYRGNIIVVGRNIKPWDIISLRDEENQMYGNFTVERVTHHFSSETGWVTTIVPMAHTVVNSLIARRQTNMVSTLAGVVASGTFNNLLWLVTGASILGAVFTGGASAVAGAGIVALARKAVLKIIPAAAKNSIKNIPATKAVIKFVGKIGASSSTAESAITKWGARAALAANVGIGSVLAQPIVGVGALAAGVYDSYSTMYLKESNMPVFINFLTYRFRPFNAGVTFEEEDILGFWALFNTALKDAGSAVAGLFEGSLNPAKSSEEFRQRYVRPLEADGG